MHKQVLTAKKKAGKKNTEVRTLPDHAAEFY